MKTILPYRNLFLGIKAGIESIMLKNEYADKVVEKILKQNPRWGSRDRGFVAETIYDLIRWKRMVEASMGSNLTSQNGWQFIGTWFLVNGVDDLPDWSEFKSLKREKILANHIKSLHSVAVRESIPDWLHKRGEKELGKQWEKELQALNQPAKTILRVNRLKASPNQVQSTLKKEYKIESDVHPNYPDALILKEKSNVFRTDLFKQGYFELQDASSQLVAPFLEVEPGMRVVDACAGAGGKALHLATLMQGKGQVLALDIYDWKLKELNRRAKRNGIHNIQSKVIAGTKTIKRLNNSADRLLIDAPCSGLGVLKRNPDAKWKLKPEFIESIRKEQAKILVNYSRILKTNGKMVYATCSILPSENQEQIQAFLQTNPNFHLIKEQIILPSLSGFDGFYMALLKRVS